MIAQSTLISYHTEAFVKTESACTVAKQALIFKIGEARNPYVNIQIDALN